MKEGKKLGIRIPARGEYGAGCVFLPRNPKEQRRCQRIVEDKVLAAGQRLLGWRDVPVDESALGPMARQSAPVIKQVIVGSGGLDQTAFERKLYVIRKWAEIAMRESGMKERGALLHAEPVVAHDRLQGPARSPSSSPPSTQISSTTDFVSALALVHSALQHEHVPHLGARAAVPLPRVTTARSTRCAATRDWMRAREQLFDGRIFGEDVDDILPIISPGGQRLGDARQRRRAARSHGGPHRCRTP